MDHWWFGFQYLGIPSAHRGVSLPWTTEPCSGGPSEPSEPWRWCIVSGWWCSRSEWVEEHGSEAEHLSCPAHSPDLNIIQPLWDVLEEHFSPPASCGHRSAREMSEDPSDHSTGHLSFIFKTHEMETLHYTDKLLHSRTRCFSVILWPLVLLSDSSPGWNSSDH